MISVSKNIVWWILLLTASLVFYVSELLESSMYIDGVWYAVISQNLAIGKGSLWFPQFSETFFAHFHEHPPMLFWLQSLYFKFLGNHWWTERLFSFTQYLTIILLMILFWRKTFRQQPMVQKLWFLPLLLWQINIANYFYLPANLMESTLIIFDMLAIFFLWRVVEKRNLKLNLFLAAFFLLLASLTKGFVGLFPFAFLGIYWLVFKNGNLPEVVLQTFVLVIIFILGFGFLFWGQPQALESLSQYFNIQVLASLKSQRTLYYFRENRLFIIGQLLWVLVPIIIFAASHLFLYHSFVKKHHPILVTSKYSFKLGIVFFLVGLSASLPIMVSPRQAMPYLLPSLPFFCLAFSVWTVPLFIAVWEYFYQRFAILKLAMTIPLSLALFSAVIWCTVKFQSPNKRDQILLSDIHKIGQVIGQEKLLSSGHYDMYLSGYLMRFYQISIDTSDQNRPFLILPKGEMPPSHFQEIQLDTEKYNIYKKRERENLLSISENTKLLDND